MTARRGEGRGWGWDDASYLVSSSVNASSRMLHRLLLLSLGRITALPPPPPPPTSPSPPLPPSTLRLPMEHGQH